MKEAFQIGNFRRMKCENLTELIKQLCDRLQQTGCRWQPRVLMQGYEPLAMAHGMCMRYE